MNDIKNNIIKIRNWMKKNNLDVYIIPHDDEFLSEYIPPENERLAWATGFTGSAGTAIIRNHDAAIFVDLNNENTFAEAIILLQDEKKRNELIQKGFIQIESINSRLSLAETHFKSILTSFNIRRQCWGI